MRCVREPCGTHVVVDMEGDEVGSEHAAEELLAKRQRDVDLGRGEWCVQEPANLDFGLRVAEHEQIRYRQITSKLSFRCHRCQYHQV